MFESNLLSWNQLDLAKKSLFIKNITARKISGDNSINLADLPLMWELYGKEFENGGNLLSEEETKSLDLNGPQLYWPALESVPHRVVEDSNLEGIETFTPNQLKRLYPNIDPTTGYYKNNPYPNENTVVYNPNILGGKDAVTLDGLHYMHDNPWYEDIYLDVVTEVVKDPNLLNHVLYELTWGDDPTGKTANALTNKILNTAQLDSNTKEVLFPAIDGYLRGQFAPDYMRHVEGGYADKYPSTGKLREAENNILSFMNSHILPNITITVNKKAGGGNLFSGSNTNSLDLKNPATYRSVVDPFLVNFVIKEEGFLDKPTDIGDGKITIGSGLTNPKWVAQYKTSGNVWDEEANRKAVEEELIAREKELSETIPNWEKLPDSSKLGLLSYKYNYNFTPKNSPKMFEALNEGNLIAAAKQMNATSKDAKFLDGLSLRRGREQLLFLRDVIKEPVGFRSVLEVPLDVIQPQSNPLNLFRIPVQQVPTNLEINLIESRPATEAEMNSSKFINAIDNNLLYNRIIRKAQEELYDTNAGIPWANNKAVGGNLLLSGGDTIGSKRIEDLTDDEYYALELAGAFGIPLDLAIVDLNNRVIHDYSNLSMIPNDNKLLAEKQLMRDALNKRSDVAKAIWDIGNTALLIADPIAAAEPIVGLYNLIKHPVRAGKQLYLFVDRGLNSADNYLNLTKNTLTRMIGTKDSGYKDALTSGIIRGNPTPPQYTAKTLGRIAPKLSKNGLSDVDVRAFTSNNIENEELWARIHNALKSISDKENTTQGVKLLKKDFTQGIGKSYEDYLQLLEKQRKFSTVDSYGKNVFTNNPEVSGWLANWKENPVATFALENEKLLNEFLFPGDYAVQINGADYWGRKATSLGHYPEHPTTFRPVEYNNPSTSFYMRQNGIFSGKPHMYRLTPEQVAIDANRYNLGLPAVDWTNWKNILTVPNTSRYNPAINTIINTVKGITDE